MIIIKSPAEIQRMRDSALIAIQAMDKALAAVRVGVSTKEIDDIAYACITGASAKPSFKGYGGFPGTACISVNEEIVHGFPGNRLLQEGDIVSIDLGAFYHGYHSDMARTVGVGSISPEAQRLIDVTRQSFFEGVKYAMAGNRLADISGAVQAYAEHNGFSVIRDFVGHGIGQELHEDPEVPNYLSKRKGPVLREGMALAIEPMLAAGKYEVEIAGNGWTAYTKDLSLSAHYENTIVIVKDGPCQILTIA